MNILSVTVEEAAARLEELIDKLENIEIDAVHITSGEKEVVMVRYSDYRDMSE